MKTPSLIFLSSIVILGCGLLKAQIFRNPRSANPVFSTIKPSGGDARKIALGRSLFFDRRMSTSMRMGCASCHDLSANGASGKALDRADSGQLSPFNTPSVFNSAFSYRFGWAGHTRNLRDQIAGGTKADLTAGSPLPLQRLQADPALVKRFRAIYGTGPNEDNVADVLAWFVNSLVTPDAPFDRWLDGDARALTPRQLRGYQSFRAIGCAGCHQGRNIGANISEPVKGVRKSNGERVSYLRVPSLRNVAVTAPYFHDGRISSLRQAVRQCAFDRLDINLGGADTADIAAFLQSLTGTYQGHPLRPARNGHR